MRKITAAVIASLLALMGGCASNKTTSPNNSGATSSATATATSPNSSEATTKAFPVTVKSCDKDITIKQEPKKVLIMGDTNAYLLDKLGVLDRVKGRTGNIRPNPYSKEFIDKLKAIPEVKAGKISSGGNKLATETVLENKFDLVIGYDSGVDRAALTQNHVNFYSTAMMCPKTKKDKASINAVNDEITRTAAIFGVPEKGKELIKQTENEFNKLAKVSKNRGTFVALWVTPGTTNDFYTYGNQSMIQLIGEMAGLKNIYSNVAGRVPDASMEDIIKHNPDYIVLLYGDWDPKESDKTLRTFNGANGLKALKQHKIVSLPLAYVDPPTPQIVDGIKKLNEELSKVDK